MDLYINLDYKQVYLLVIMATNNLFKYVAENLPNIKHYSVSPGIDINLDTLTHEDLISQVEKYNLFSIEHYGKEFVDLSEFKLKCNNLKQKYDNIIGMNGSNTVKLTIPESPASLQNTEASKLEEYELFEFNDAKMNHGATLLLMECWENEDFRKYSDAFCDRENKRMDSPSWIYTYAYNIPDSLSRIALAWKTITNDRYNLSPLFITAPYNLTNYSIIDNSLLYRALISKINNNIGSLNYLINIIRSKVCDIVKRETIQANLNKHKSIGEYLKANNYDMDYIYEDESSGKDLTNIITAIKAIPGAQKWIVEKYKSIYTSDEMLDKIQVHPSFVKSNHSGCSAMWAFRAAKQYFKLGPEQYAHDYLLSNDFVTPAL